MGERKWLPLEQQDLKVCCSNWPSLLPPIGERERKSRYRRIRHSSIINDRGNSDDANGNNNGKHDNDIGVLSFPSAKIRKICRIDPEVKGISKEADAGVFTCREINDPYFKFHALQIENACSLSKIWSFNSSFFKVKKMNVSWSPKSQIETRAQNCIIVAAFYP